MSKSSTKILDSFQKKLKSLENIRDKQEYLFSKNKVFRRSIEEVYGAIFLNAIVSFEAFIEDLFIGLLAGRIFLKQYDFNVRVKIKSHAVAREVVLHGQNYYDWLPYENTERIANIFFAGGRPFTVLTKEEKKHIDKCIKIRNVIAHQSKYAINKFNNDVLANLSLTKRERNPKSFLRAQFSANPPLNYYQQLVGDLLTIAHKLC